MPLDRRGMALCSQEFVRLWNLTPPATETLTQFAMDSIAGALDAAGISAAELLARISAIVTKTSESIPLTREDGVSVQVSAQCILDESSGAIVGHLVRFNVSSDTSEIKNLLDQIADSQRKLSTLSKRELEILNLIYDGRTNKAVSIVTGISQKTVEKHRARIALKLGLQSTAMLVRLITVARLLPMPLQNGGDQHSKNRTTDLDD
ncbi:MAG TPA: helix-turn-helix transcriptional regulator [Planctomycetaceae bacterium]|nr:helix-turn-helix transcriptional regulator [Planctomycetaceae bacterium]HQZ63684.1 helix-turn-helix transcriptional regulator [Planctomycetaceae bacterium]